MKLRSNNKYRVLLTEVLPNELPIVLDNHAFYVNMQDHEIEAKIRELFFKTDTYTIPFTYRIRKSGGKKSRLMSFMHPYNQLRFVDFYEKYAGRMLYYTGLNSFSLRHPVRIAPCVVEQNKIQSSLDDALSSEVKEYANYFDYKPYSLINKFFEGGDLLRLEQKYTYSLKLDVATCFYSIYSHSITWAIKGIDYAKQHSKDKNFENEFDKLMQHCNYNETNGIVVGPEISRIFAEIILQKIDNNIQESLTKKNLVLREDYEIRRYVDDYFVYAHSQKNLEVIRDVIDVKLEEYHLSINKNKVEYKERPFSANIAVARSESVEYVNRFFEEQFRLEDENKRLPNYLNLLQQFGGKIRDIVYRNSVTYDAVVSHVLSTLLFKIAQRYKEIALSEHIASLTLHIAFYVFLLDMYATTSGKLCKVIYQVLKNIPSEIRGDIETIIRRECKRCFDIYTINQMPDTTNLEIMNLLLVANRVANFEFSPEVLCDIFHLKNSEHKFVLDNFVQLDYFQTCVLLDLVQDKLKYKEIHQMLIKGIKKKYEKFSSMKYAELILLMFDLIACPYIDEQTKKEKVLKKVLAVRSGLTELDEFYKVFAKPQCWFYDWNKDKDIIDFIQRKSFTFPYG